MDLYTHAEWFVTTAQPAGAHDEIDRRVQYTQSTQASAPDEETNFGLDAPASCVI